MHVKSSMARDEIENTNTINESVHAVKRSPIDEKSQELWDQYTAAKHSMLFASYTALTPWIIVRSDNKRKARLNCIKHVLNTMSYSAKRNKKFSISKKILSFGDEEIALMEANMSSIKSVKIH